MRRVTVLCGLIAFGALSLAVSAQQAAPMVVEVQKVKDNFYIFTGGGGNTALFLTAKGAVVVDTKNPGWGKPLLEKIRTVTKLPITTIINTHTHGDHVSGNVDFPATVDVVVQENTKTNMEKMIPNSTAPDQTVPKQTIFGENGGRGLPKRTFKDKMVLGSGAEEIDLYYFGRGHTNGDAFVVFPALRIMHAGDIYSGKNLPLLDQNNGGSAVQIIDTLLKAHDAVPNIDTVIPGHSTLMTRADLREYVEFNRDFLNDVRAMKKAGKTIDQAAAEWKMPAKYSNYAAPVPVRLRGNIELVYKETP